MITSNFLNILKKKLLQLDTRRLYDIVLELIGELENMQTVFNSMIEGVLVIDNDNTVLYVNRTASRYLGIGQEHVGQDIRRTTSEHRVLKAVMICLESDGRITEGEVAISGENGSDVKTFVKVSMQTLVRDGKIIGTIFIITNISENKENEKKLKQAESLAALTTISAGIAHEIKNPLGAMGIHIQLIQDEIKKCTCGWADNIKYSTGIVNEEIQRLNDIVVNYLYTVRPLNIELLPVDLGQVLDRIAGFVTPELESRGVQLQKVYADSLPEIFIDEKSFKQAVLNLIQNSLAVLDETGIIKIEASTEKNYVIIHIVDNGPGIPEELQPKIFDPYFTTRATGTGLGLTIVYKIIKEHNGEISFSSRPGRTVFTIKLPATFVEKGLIEYQGDENGD